VEDSGSEQTPPQTILDCASHGPEVLNVELADKLKAVGDKHSRGEAEPVEFRLDARSFGSWPSTHPNPWDKKRVDLEVTKKTWILSSGNFHNNPKLPFQISPRGERAHHRVSNWSSFGGREDDDANPRGGCGGPRRVRILSCGGTSIVCRWTRNKMVGTIYW